MLQLDLLKFQDQVQIQQVNNKRMIFDPIRKKKLVLTPEELVRQLLILYLIEEKAYPKNWIAVEKALRVNGRLRRWDMLVYNSHTQPAFLIECKAPKVPLTQMTFEQIARYNLEVRVPYLLVSNGRQSHCCQIDFINESFHFLQEIPDPEHLNSI